MDATMNQFKLFLSIEKEEAWLEEMAKSGWHLVKTPGLVYTFQKGKPEERIYRIDFRFFNTQKDLDEYLTLFEDSGWQPIDPRRSRNSFYFYHQQEGADLDIFSDDVSKAQRSYRFASYMFYTFLISFLPYLVLLMNGNLNPANAGYLTPGLWDMKGWTFVHHFLFETPFVLARVTFSYLPLIFLVIAAIFVFRSYRQYKKIERTR